MGYASKNSTHAYVHSNEDQVKDLNEEYEKVVPSFIQEIKN